MGRLNDLGVKYRTDKSSLYHGYLDFYEGIFNELGFTEESHVRLCEIGVLGGASLRMWNAYFYNTHFPIVGIDINALADDVLIANVDAYSPKGLAYIKNEIQPEILIDDGSHRSKDIITLVNSLLETKDEYFPKVFIYEDCHASFWEDYTPKGEKNAYHYCTKVFTDLGYDIREYNRLPDLSDSVTMAIIKK